MKKKFLCLILTFVMVFSLIPSAVATANDDATEAAETLYALGLFRGTGTNADGTPIFALEQTPSRNQAVIMLVRLLGKEQEALTGNWELPFTDVPKGSTAYPYIGYAYANGLTNGTTATTYSGGNPIRANQYITFVLRAMGYVSGEDFTVSTAWEFSDAIGLTHGEYNAKNAADFIRGDVALISEAALWLNCKGSGQTLLQQVRQEKQPAIDFGTLLEEVSEEHRAMFDNSAVFDTFSTYLREDAEAAKLLTQEEIAILLDYSRAHPATITYQQAAYDVDVLFRAFKSAYGAYYYFGEGAFDEAQAEMIAWLKGKSSVRVEDFSRALVEAFDFLRDAHSYVANRQSETDIRYEYYYCLDQHYALDKTGYYKYITGEKWYVAAFSDARVTMEPSLTAAGELVYAPVLFCTVSTMKNSTLTLKNAAGETKTQTLSWKLSVPYGESFRTPEFELLEQQGIAYIAVRNFNHEYEKGELADFVASGTAVKNAKAVIFDIRANGGGGDSFGRDWVQNFTGKRPAITECFAQRYSPLFAAAWEKRGFPVEEGVEIGTYRANDTLAKQIPNDIPIIVLVDDKCGSAGESMLNFLRGMDNVLVIGSNSAGFQLGGNTMAIRLPNSNLPADFGSALQFAFTAENVDYKGYEPDVWCNPAIALGAALNMLLRYEVAEVSTWSALRCALGA